MAYYKAIHICCKPNSITVICGLHLKDQKFIQC